MEGEKEGRKGKKSKFVCPHLSLFTSSTERKVFLPSPPPPPLSEVHTRSAGDSFLQLLALVPIIHGQGGVRQGVVVESQPPPFPELTLYKKYLLDF